MLQHAGQEQRHDRIQHLGGQIGAEADPAEDDDVARKLALVAASLAVVVVVILRSIFLLPVVGVKMLHALAGVHQAEPGFAALGVGGGADVDVLDGSILRRHIELDRIIRMPGAPQSRDPGALVPIWKSIDVAWVLFVLIRIHQPSRTGSAALAVSERIDMHARRNEVINRNRDSGSYGTSNRRWTC